MRSARLLLLLFLVEEQTDRQTCRLFAVVKTSRKWTVSDETTLFQHLYFLQIQFTRTTNMKFKVRMTTCTLCLKRRWIILWLNPCPGAQSFFIFKQMDKNLHFSTCTCKPTRDVDRKASSDISLWFVFSSTFDWSWLWTSETSNSSLRASTSDTNSVFKCCFRIRSSPAYASPRMYMKISIDSRRTIFYTRMVTVIYCIEL